MYLNHIFCIGYCTYITNNIKKLILLLVIIAGCKCFLTEKNVNKDLFTSQRFVSPVSRF